MAVASSKWKREGPSLTTLVRADQRRIAHLATDRATTWAKDETRTTIVAVGLGRLANAVGSTSSLKRKGYSQTDNAWGAVYARGSTEGRGNQALLAYSQGAAIYPRNGRQWLAFETRALPQRAGGKRMTPALYRSSGLEQSIGKLHFVSGRGGKVAFLVARSVVVSRRSGRILRQQGGRKTRGSDNKDSVVAFILIRFTLRAQRWSQDRIMQEAAGRVPLYADDIVGDR